MNTSIFRGQFFADQTSADHDWGQFFADQTSADHGRGPQMFVSQFLFFFLGFQNAETMFKKRKMMKQFHLNFSSRVEVFGIIFGLRKKSFFQVLKMKNHEKNIFENTF